MTTTGPNPIALAPGQVIAGRYRVERILGYGGMGVVAAARHMDLDEIFAVKVMIVDGSLNQEWIERFVREARTAAKLKSVHAAKVVDSGRLEDGAPFLAMEYLKGRDLSNELHVRGPLPALEAATYIFQACDVLTEAHALGIVHRDLKPANLFLTQLPNGAACIKVLDFGIAKHEDAVGGARMTQTSNVFGTPIYMSPEHMRSAKLVDARSDIWSLGVVLYELCTGTLPYDGESMTALVAQVMTEPPVPPSKRRAGIPPEIEAIILRCLERDPVKRYPSAAALAQALAATMGEHRPTLPSFPDGAMRITGQHALTPQWGAGGTHGPLTSTSVRLPGIRQRTGLLAGLISFAVGLLVIGTIIAIRYPSDSTPGAASSSEAAPPPPAVASSSPQIIPASASAAEPAPPPSATVSAAIPSVTAEPSAPATASAAPLTRPLSSAGLGPGKPPIKPPTKPTAQPASTRGTFF
jgi:serine/threonine protein kinase